MNHPATVTAGLGLSRITVHSPQRRIDVAVPATVALAELLPALLRHAGMGLADSGEQHGGWVARRADGSLLDEGKTLAQQGVRDGEVLHLVPALQQWPQLEYDDVAEAVAAASRRLGADWTPDATRKSTLVGAGLLLAAGALSLLYSGPSWGPGSALAGAVALALLGTGILASRAYGDGIAGSALGGFALLYAFTGGALAVGDTDPTGIVVGMAWLGAPALLVGSVALLLFAALGAAGVGHGTRVFVAGGMVGAHGAAGALLAGLGATGAAAILLTLLVCGISLLPLLAVRFGKVPLPSVALPHHTEPAGAGAGRTFTSDLPDRDRVFASVSRAEELLTGMLLGCSVLVGVTSLVLSVSGDTSGQVLVAVAATALLLRSRLFITTRQRLPLIAAGLLGHLLTLGGLAGVSGLRGFFTVAAVMLALAVMLAGLLWSGTAPSPYLGRFMDVFELITMVSVVPVAAWVLGIYATIQGWAA